MQRSGATPASSTASSSFFSTSFFSSSASASKPRPGTSSGDPPAGGPLGSSAISTSNPLSRPASQAPPPPPIQTDLVKDRKGSFGRRGSLGSPSKTSRRRANSSIGGTDVVVTDSKVPPALPDFALAAAAKINNNNNTNNNSSNDNDINKDAEAAQSPNSVDSFSRMLGRTPTGQSMGERLAPATSNQPIWAGGSEASVVHLQMQELANKRISTLNYLRKAHESRVYWYNTVLFDRNDVQRFPSYDPRKLARRATNYLLLGLSLPSVADLNSHNPFDYLRSINSLLQEFESFQQLHGESGSSASSLSRARLPQMFRRGPSGKSRRSNSGAADIGLPGGAGVGGGGATGAAAGGGTGGAGGGLGGADDAGNGGIASAQNANVVNFAHSEMDLYPGEEYSLLLTPVLPFEPDYFETFATLCDVLVDIYTRLLSLMPTPAVATAPVAELFAKVDGRIRKIIVQGTIKEFEDQSRAHVKTEVANIGKVVLGGLM